LSASWVSRDRRHRRSCSSIAIILSPSLCSTAW
jgi:hypothetical protein